MIAHLCGSMRAVQQDAYNRELSQLAQFDANARRQGLGMSPL